MFTPIKLSSDNQQIPEPSSQGGFKPINLDGTPQSAIDTVNKKLYPKNDFATLFKQSAAYQLGDALTGIPTVAKDFGQSIVANYEAGGATENKVSAIGDKQTQLIAEAHRLPMGPQRTNLLRQAMRLSDTQNQLASSVNKDVGSITTTPFQALKDTAGSLLKTGSLAVGGEGAGAIADTATSRTLSMSEKIAQGTMQGFKNGFLGGGLQGVGGALQDPNSGVMDVVQRGLKDAFVGGGTGGITGGLIPLITEGVSSFSKLPSKIIGMIKGRTEQEILATPESLLKKLTTAERQIWNKAAQEQINSQHDELLLQVEAKHQAIGQGIEKELQDQGDITTQKSKDLIQKLGTSSNENVVNLRPTATKFVGQQSVIYRKLFAEAVTPVADNPVITTDLNSWLNNKFSDNPEIAQSMKQILGTVENVNPISDTTNVVSKVKSQTTIGELVSRMQGLKQSIGSAARKGSAVFTPSDKATDDAISLLSQYLKENGVDLSIPNKFWSKWAPVRDQLVKEGHIFNQAGTRSETLASTMVKVAQGKDPGSVNFIKQLEQGMGPINDENKAIIAEMDANKKVALANQVKAESDKIANDMAAKDAKATVGELRGQALKNLNSKQLEIDRQARINKFITKALKTVAGGLLGKTVGGTTGEVIGGVLGGSL